MQPHDLETGRLTWVY